MSENSLRADPSILHSPAGLVAAPAPPPLPRRRGRPRLHPVRDTAFGCARDFLDNRFVYLVVTPRVHGLLACVNVAPDKRCNFDCVYCEVDRTTAPHETCVNLVVMAAELARTLQFVQTGQIRERPTFRALPEELLKVGHVAIAGEGEPTLCPQLVEIVETVAHVRAQGSVPFFKLVLVTNASLVDTERVRAALRFFTHEDDLWLKLDAGTQSWMDRINRTAAPLSLERVLENILLIARQRPVVIQSMFPAINGEDPPASEIDEYARRLCELRDAGAQIQLAQICSATRPSPRSPCGHLGLRALSRIAFYVRQATGLPVEVC